MITAFTRALPKLGLCACLVAASGCTLRDLDTYQRDVRQLLEVRKPIVQACYDAELQLQPAGGRVVVDFKIERATGRILEPRVDPARSSADRTLRGCVLESLRGLSLRPPEERDGEATFIWEFRQAR